MGIVRIRPRRDMVEMGSVREVCDMIGEPNNKQVGARWLSNTNELLYDNHSHGCEKSRGRSNSVQQCSG